MQSWQGRCPSRLWQQLARQLEDFQWQLYCLLPFFLLQKQLGQLPQRWCPPVLLLGSLSATVTPVLALLLRVHLIVQPLTLLRQLCLQLEQHQGLALVPLQLFAELLQLLRPEPVMQQPSLAARVQLVMLFSSLAA